MVTIIFAEGKTDVYFFQNALTILKNSQTVTPYDCRDARAQYNTYMNKSVKTIVRSDDKYAILIGCDGKSGAINTFIGSAEYFLRVDNPVTKLFLVVDKDSSQKLGGKISNQLQLLINKFSENDVTLTSFHKDNELHNAAISRGTKSIQLKFTEVKPNLEVIISTLLRDYSEIPKDNLEGDAHEIIQKACKYWNINGTNELCTYLAQNYAEKLKLTITQVGLEHSICHML